LNESAETLAAIERVRRTRIEDQIRPILGHVSDESLRGNVSQKSVIGKARGKGLGVESSRGFAITPHPSTAENSRCSSLRESR
jgi:hypothetical protein